MSVSLGELVIDLVLNADGIQDQFDSIYEQSLVNADKVERSFRSVSPQVPKSLHLVPTVDLSGLHELNQVLDMKELHVNTLQKKFDDKPLTPRVDTSELKALDRQIAGLEKRLNSGMTATIGLNPQKAIATNDKPRDVAADTVDRSGKAVVGAIAHLEASVLTALEVAVADLKQKSLAGQVTGNILGNLSFGLLTPITQNLGKGVTEGIEGQLSKFIGSTELLGEALTNKLGAAVGAIKLPTEKLEDFYEAVFEGLIEDAQDEGGDRAKKVRKFKESLDSIIEVATQAVSSIELVDPEARRTEELSRQRGRSQDLLAKNPLAQRQAELNRIEAKREERNASEIDQRLGNTQASLERQIAASEQQIKAIAETALSRLEAQGFSYQELDQQGRLNSRTVQPGTTDIFRADVDVLEATAAGIESQIETTKSLESNGKTRALLKKQEEQLAAVNSKIAEHYRGVFRLAGMAADGITDAEQIALSSAQENLQELSQQLTSVQSLKAESSKNLDRIRSEVSSADQALDPIASAPRQYEALVQTVAQNAGVAITPEQMPQLIPDTSGMMAQLGANAAYSSGSNQIIVNADLYERLMAQGQISAKEKKTLLHELQHAFDFDFGSLEGRMSRDRGEGVRDFTELTEQEMLKYRDFIQRYSPQKRGYELNAEVNAGRALEDIEKQEFAKARTAEFEQRFGLGGAFLGGANATLQEALTATGQRVSSDQDIQRLQLLTEQGSTFAREIKAQQEKGVQTRGDADTVIQSTDEAIASLEGITAILDELAQLQRDASLAEIKEGMGASIAALKALKGQVDPEEFEQLKAQLVGSGATTVSSQSTQGELDQSVQAMRSLTSNIAAVQTSLGIAPIEQRGRSAVNPELNLNPPTPETVGMGQEVVVTGAIATASLDTVAEAVHAAAETIIKTLYEIFGDASLDQVQQSPIAPPDPHTANFQDAIAPAMEALTPEQMQQNFADESVSRGKAIADKFVENYQVFKKVLAGQNPEEIAVYASMLNQMAENATAEIDQIIDSLGQQGIDTNFAGDVGSKLQNYKAQLSRKQGLVGKQYRKATGETLPSVESTYSAPSPGRVGDRLPFMPTQAEMEMAPIQIADSDLDAQLSIDPVVEQVKRALEAYGYQVNDSILQNIKNMAAHERTQEALIKGAATTGATALGMASHSPTGMVAANVAAKYMSAAGISALRKRRSQQGLVGHLEDEGSRDDFIKEAVKAGKTAISGDDPIFGLVSEAISHYVEGLLKTASSESQQSLGELLSGEDAQKSIAAGLVSAGKVAVQGASSDPIVKVITEIAGKYLTTVTQSAIASKQLDHSAGGANAINEAAEQTAIHATKALDLNGIVQHLVDSTDMGEMPKILLESVNLNTMVEDTLKELSTQMAGSGIPKVKAFIENQITELSKGMPKARGGMVFGADDLDAQLSDIDPEELTNKRAWLKFYYELLDKLKTANMGADELNQVLDDINDSQTQQLVEVAENESKDLNDAVYRSTVALEQANAVVSEADDAIARSGSGTRTPMAYSSVSNIDPNEVIDISESDAKAMNDRASGVVEVLDKLLEFDVGSQDFNEAFGKLPPLLNDANGELSEFIRNGLGLENIAKWLKQGAAALGGFVLFSLIGDDISEFANSSLEAALNFERLSNTFKFVTGSAASAADQIARIREESNTLGTDAIGGLEGYAQLAAASRGTSLEGAATEQLSSAVQQAAAVSQLDAESLGRANTAIAQIAGKGKLSAEELRQQLAEVGGVFSGSFSIAARALGVTTSELDQMLQRGEVLSEDFLPKFAQQLSAETSTGVAGAANSAQASINRFNNKMTELQEVIGKPLMEGRRTFLGFGAEALEKLIDLAPIAISLLTGLAAKLAVDLGKAGLNAFGGLGAVTGAIASAASPSFGDVDFSTGKASTFGDRVVDGAIGIGRLDVKDLGADALDAFKSKANDAADTAEKGFNKVRQSWAKMTDAFKQRSFGELTPDQFARGGVGFGSMFKSAPSFGDLSLEELSTGTGNTGKGVQKRFADMAENTRTRMMMMREDTIASFTSMKTNAVATAKTMQVSLTNSAVKAGTAIATTSRTAAVSFLNIGKSAATAAMSIASAVAPMLAITAAIEAFKIGSKFFSDLSGEMGEMVKSSEELAKNYTMALEKLRAMQSGEPPDIGASSEAEAIANQNVLQEGGGIGAWFANIERSSMENYRDRAIAQAEGKGASDEEIEAIRDRWNENFQISSISGLLNRKAYGQRQDAFDDQIDQFQATIGAAQSPELLTAADEVKQIDEEVRRLNAQKNSSSDIGQRQEIQDRIDELMVQRGDRSEGIGAIQGALSADIQKAQDAIKLYDDQLANNQITHEQYQENVSALNAELDVMEQQLDALGNAIEMVRSPLAKMNDALSEAAAIATDMDLTRAIEDAQAQLDLATQQGEMGDAAFSQLSSQFDVERIQREIEANAVQMQGIREALDQAAIDQSFARLANAGISRDMSPNQLIDALGKTGLGDDNTDVQTLQAFAEKGIELQQLEASTLSLQAELSTSRADLQQQAKDLAREYRELTLQISDFYRDAYRSAEDVANQIVSQDFQNATQEISNDIQRELLGLEDSFVSGIGDTFVGLIEAIRQPMLDELDAISERNNITREFEDQLRSAEDLQREADHFDFNAGLGADPDTNLPSPSAIAGTEGQDYITDAQGRRWPTVIDIPGFVGGGHFLGEGSHENQPMAPIAIPQNTLAPTAPDAVYDNIRNDDIAAATALAERGRDEQLAAIDRNLATQADTASLEADRAIAGISRQLEDGRRTISEQSQSFERSLRDISADIGNQNPMRELERSLLAVSDQFTDTNQDLEDFRRGLQDTIDETTMVRQQLLDGVRAGTIGQEALAILPELDQTIAESQNALLRADSQVEQNRELLEAQRAQIIKDFEDAEKARRRDAQIRLVQGRQEIDTLRVDNFRVSPFDLDAQKAKEQAQFITDIRGQEIEIGLAFDGDMRELDELLETGELTKNEYAGLRDNLIEVSELKLDGLKNQFEQMLPTVEAIASALGTATGEVNQDAFDQIQSNLNLAAQSGAISSDQAREARAGLNEARSIANTRGDREAIRALMSSDNAFTSQFLSQAGRGDLTSIADLGIQNQQAEQARRSLRGIETDPKALAGELTRPELAQANDFGNVFAESSDRMVGALDRLTDALTNSGQQGGRVTVQQQNVTVSRDEEAIARRAVQELNKYMEQKI